MTIRIVSLVPSVTETLLAWGVEPVAVTRFCEQPSFETVGGTKDPTIDRIVALAPDVVVLNDEENWLEDHDALVAAGLAVHVVRITTVHDVAPQLRALRVHVGLESGDDEPLRPARAPRVRAFVPIWRRPWMTINAATYGSSLLEHVGVVNVCASHPTRYPEVALADIDADVVLAPSEPYPFAERHRAELETVAPVVFVDGRDLFWWGTRTHAAISRLDATMGRL